MTKQEASQPSPAEWTTFKWEGTTDFKHYVTVVLLLAVILIAELNPLYLKVRWLSWIVTKLSLWF
jgi:phosphatidylserine synthase 2